MSTVINPENSPYTFSEEFRKVIEAYQRISEKGLDNIFPSEDWKILFNYRNARVMEKGGRFLGMGCKPCYKEVYNFVEENIKIYVQPKP